MDIVLDSSLIGSQKNLLVSSDGFTWTERINDSSWHFSGHIKSDSSKCWDTVMKLAMVPSSSIPKIPEPYIKAMSHFAQDQVSPPWSMILPPSKYKTFFNDIVKYVQSNTNISTDYYQNVWVPGNKILNVLKPAKVDGLRISEIVSLSATNAPVVESFRPRAGGYASPIVYDRFGTVTGRLIVDSGPNILLLKKDYRSILKPSNAGGKIISIDFSSLEARILLYESGNDCPEFDLYGMLARQFGNMPRDLVKAAVLSVLYGSSKSAVALNLGVSEDKVINVIRQIEEYIDTRALVRKLRQQHQNLGYIQNRYGRRLNVDRPQDNIFISYYAQSTGVDVSLMGFSNVFETLGSEGIRPIFVLHDALILDVHPDRLEDVAKVCKVKVPGYDQEFPLKIEEISR
jgi:hypothetical protein